jgi:4-hydroxymandelate oxidase
MLGRPGLFGLAAAGAEGARRMLAILEDELNNAMTLMGTRTLSELTPANLAEAGRPLETTAR